MTCEFDYFSSFFFFFFYKASFELVIREAFLRNYLKIDVRYGFLLHFYEKSFHELILNVLYTSPPP